MIHELPWLVRPTRADREELASLRGDTNVIQEMARLAKLAQRGWNESELRSIGRRLRKLLQSIADDSATGTIPGYTRTSLLIISSSTANYFVEALCASALRAGILLECRVVEYEDPESWLEANATTFAANPPDITLLALDRRTFNLRAKIGDAEAARACISHAVDRARHIIDRLTAMTRHPVIVQTIAGGAEDPQSSMDAWLPGSPRHLAVEFNRTVAEATRECSAMLFDVAAIANLVGHATWHAGRYWYAAKLPFAPECVPLYCYRLVQLLSAMLGKSRRVLVLDLDETLWGGIVGDDGMDGLVLGPGSARGEAHLEVQRMARRYRERGIVLCVSSKNDEQIAREAFRRHPEMLLREPEIALFRVNWSDKASNIASLAEALDLGLEAFVLLDDNPVERKQVRDALPGVAVPELPADPSEWLPVIQAAAYFEQVSFSTEDEARTEYYRANALRSVQAQTIGDHRKFLESLQMQMSVAPFDSVGRARIAQLIAKSNQFNLTTRRYSESEVAALARAPGCECLQIRLQDVFGDNGMISVIVCRKDALFWDIDTWIMSCRVLGRGVEQAALALIVERARAAGAQELRGTYIPTAKNGLVRDHYAKLGFAKTEERPNGETTWKLPLQGFVSPVLPITVRETAVHPGSEQSP